MTWQKKALIVVSLGIFFYFMAWILSAFYAALMPQMPAQQSLVAFIFTCAMIGILLLYIAYDLLKN